MKVSLLEFIKTGAFGDVLLGMTREELMQVLGEPPAWMNNRRDTSPIWAWDDFEFYFNQDHQLYMIFTDSFFPTPVGERNLEVDGWIIHKDLTLEIARKEFDAQKIRYQLVSKESLNRYILLCISGVVLSFDKTEKGDYQITAIKKSVVIL